MTELELRVDVAAPAETTWAQVGSELAVRPAFTWGVRRSLRKFARFAEAYHR